MKTFMCLVVLFSLSFGAFAESDNLKLKGKVPKKLSIEVIPEAIALNLDLETSQTSLLVAKVSEKSNSNSGFKVTADSVNNGFLVNSSDANSKIAYSMAYDGAGVNLSTTATVTEDLNPGAIYYIKNVTIAYTGALHETRVEGSYTDTVTFTISAN